MKRFATPVWVKSARLAPALMLAVAAACGGPVVTLHAPTCAPSSSRSAPTRVEMEPIVLRDAAPPTFARPDPAAAITSGITSELRARALTGGDPGGYAARCNLDRFALRTAGDASSARELTLAYADLSCAVDRIADHVPVWRGELRGRAATMGSTSPPSGGESGALQLRADRLMSDLTRELASDLSVRALGLTGSPSARVFRDEEATKGLAGIDDSSFGSAALSESTANVPTFVTALRDPDLRTRAAAWNVLAMAAGPGDPWLGGPKLALDEEALVRFYQYKALARLGSASSLAELRRALPREDDALIVEFLGDAIASGGIGVARSRPTPEAKAIPATNGRTTSP